MGIKQVLRAVSNPATQRTVNGHEAAVSNAMIACTALARSRLERIEVEEIVARHEQRMRTPLAAPGLNQLGRTG